MANGARRRALRQFAGSSWVKRSGGAMFAIFIVVFMGHFTSGGQTSNGNATSGGGNWGAASFQRALGDLYKNRLRTSTSQDSAPLSGNNHASQSTDQEHELEVSGAEEQPPPEIDDEGGSGEAAGEGEQEQGQEEEEQQQQQQGEEPAAAAEEEGTVETGNSEGEQAEAAIVAEPSPSNSPAPPSASSSNSPAATSPPVTPSKSEQPPPPPPAASLPTSEQKEAEQRPAKEGVPQTTVVNLPEPGSGASDGTQIQIDTIPTPGRDRAIVTLATGDEAARMALVLVQSLRDVGTDPNVDVVVLLFTGGLVSEDCLQGDWRRAHGRGHINCGSPDNVAEEIISPRYVNAFRRLGAKVVVMPAIERYQHTKDIPGGTSSFWGMALNKLIVFRMTQYRKIIFMDGDTLFFRNIDHLWSAPTLTASITYSCCNNNAPAIPSGGLWVLEPSDALWSRIDEAMRLGEPVFDGKTGQPVIDPATGKQQYQEWRLGDMAIVRLVFSDWPRNHALDRLWPWVQDTRHGHVEGIRTLPVYKGLTDDEFKAVIWDPVDKVHYKEGFQPDRWDGVTPVWHALNVSYDQCIAVAECLPWRHTPYRKLADGSEEGYFSVHFTCMQGGTIEKPGKFNDDNAFWSAISTAHYAYQGFYFIWYEKFERANGGPLGGTRYPGERPTPNWEAFFNPPTKVHFDRR